MRHGATAIAARYTRGMPAAVISAETTSATSTRDPRYHARMDADLVPFFVVGGIVGVIVIAVQVWACLVVIGLGSRVQRIDRTLDNIEAELKKRGS